MTHLNKRKNSRRTRDNVWKRKSGNKNRSPPINTAATVENHADTAASGEGTIHLKLKMHERKSWGYCVILTNQKNLSLE